MTTWAMYVRRLIGDDSQAAVEARTRGPDLHGIRQSTVSRWLNGQTQRPQAAEASRLAQAYGGNVLEAFIAAGFLTEEEAGIPPTPRREFADLIDADPDLSAEAKIHIKNQYSLLKVASANSYMVLLREQIERSQTLDDETRDQLLATMLEGSFVKPTPAARRSRRTKGHKSKS